MHYFMGIDHERCSPTPGSGDRGLVADARHGPVPRWSTIGSSISEAARVSIKAGKFPYVGQNSEAVPKVICPVPFQP